MGNIFILISVLINVAGQSVLKTGVNRLGSLAFELSGLIKAFTSLYVWGGLALYGISSIFWILALSHKDLSYAYPMLSVGYIAIILVSWAFLGEEITLPRLAGVLFISFGIFLIFKSS